MAQQKEKEQAERHVSVFWIIEDERSEIFESDSAMDFLQLARQLRDIQQSGPLHGEALAGTLGKAYPLDRDDFDARVQRFMGGGEEIRGMFEIDLDRKKVSALDRAEGWMDYSIKNACAAAYYADRKERRPEDERREVFLARLEGKALNIPLNRAAKLRFGM